MKKVEDYIHLYLGCECYDTFRKVTGILTAIFKNSVRIDNGYGQWHISTIKPILRRLETMTEEEANELDWRFPVEEDANIVIKNLNPDEFLYLLKQGFDLFNLIEEGLAIDKSK